MGARTLRRMSPSSANLVGAVQYTRLAGNLEPKSRTLEKMDPRFTSLGSPPAKKIGPQQSGKSSQRADRPPLGNLSKIRILE